MLVMDSANNRRPTKSATIASHSPRISSGKRSGIGSGSVRAFPMTFNSGRAPRIHMHFADKTQLRFHKPARGSFSGKPRSRHRRLKFSNAGLHATRVDDQSHDFLSGDEWHRKKRRECKKPQERA